MANLNPLKIDSNGNLAEFTPAEKTQLIQRAVYKYIMNPSKILTQVASGGNLGTISDTRMKSGASSVNASDYPAETTTQEPQIVTVNFARVSQSSATVNDPGDPGDDAFLTYNNSKLTPMSRTDLHDSIIFPAIDAAKTEAYKIATSAFSNYTSMGAVFTDTRENLNNYLASNIGEAGTYQDWYVTAATYYIYKAGYSTLTGDQIFTTELPARFNTSTGKIEPYTLSQLDAVLESYMRYAAVNVPGMIINYSWNGTGDTCGNGISDTGYNGFEGNYVTSFIGLDDYRAQEFPTGTLSTLTAYYLKADLT